MYMRQYCNTIRKIHKNTLSLYYNNLHCIMQEFEIINQLHLYKVIKCTLKLIKVIK